MQSPSRFSLRALKTNILLLTFVVSPFFSMTFAMSQPPQPPTKNPTETIRNQMRWKLEAGDWDFGVPLPLERIRSASPQELDTILNTEKRYAPGANLHRTIEALILENTEASKQRAIEILEKLIERHSIPDIHSVVTPHGVEYEGYTVRQESAGRVFEAQPPNEQRLPVESARDLAFEYATLYLLTGRMDYATKSRDILLRFAEVAGQWPLYDRDNKPHAQTDAAYWENGNVNGLWSVWAPLDFRMSLPLLRAYDIIRPTLSEQEKKTIEDGFFIHQKETLEHFKLMRDYHNLGGYWIVPLFRFGVVLNRPDYVHEVVGFWKRMLNYSYTPDGFWKEVTPSYHRQISSRMEESLPNVIKGYSDPPGYVDAKDGTRFDNLDAWTIAGPQLHQMHQALQTLAMPDGTLVSINDAWPKNDAAEAPSDAPGLLGIAGVAKLGAEGMTAFLQFGGLRGHDHHDALNLVWFAGRREVFSETGYQALPDSGSTREWHTISASHNTVAVNETTQFQNPQRMLVPRDVEPTPGVSSVWASLPGAVAFANQGRLILWRAESNSVQAMEAEQENAYPGVTSLFRRTVVMVPAGKGDGYLVDIFRVQGGKIHDYFLRGGLDQPYTMKFDMPLQPADGMLYKYIRLTQSGSFRPPLSAVTAYPDGYQVHSHLLTVGEASPGNLQLLVGEAPAIRRLGTAIFSVIRHQAPESQNRLKTGFVWVHEAGERSEIQSVSARETADGVIVTIQRKDRTDHVLSGENDTSSFDFQGWTFTGRLAFASEAAGKTDGLVLQGGALEKNGARIASPSPVVSGSVLETTRRDAGATMDSLLVQLDEESPMQGFVPKLAHVDFGGVIQFSIPVRNATYRDGRLLVELVHSPGFDLKEGKAIMTNSPGWTYNGIPAVRLDCVSSDE